MSVVGLLGKTQVILSDARAAGTIASGSIGVSYANVVGWLNGNVGLIASLLGIVLTLVTIKVQWTNGKKAELELRRLQREMADCDCTE